MIQNSFSFGHCLALGFLVGLGWGTDVSAQALGKGETVEKTAVVPAVAEAEKQAEPEKAKEEEKVVEQEPPVPERVPAFRVDGDRGAGGVVFFGKVPERIGFERAVCGWTPGAVFARDEEEGVLRWKRGKGTGESVRVELAGEDGSCEEPREIRLHFGAAGRLPRRPNGKFVVWFDAGIGEFSAGSLMGFQLAVLLDDKVAASSTCAKGAACALALGEDVREAMGQKRGRVVFLLLPERIPLVVGKGLPCLVGVGAPAKIWRRYTIGTQSILFEHALVKARKLDTAQDSHQLRLRFARALESVSCEHARCRVTDGGILIYHVDASAAAVRMRYSLREGYARLQGARRSRYETAVFRLERCSIKIPGDVPLLAGATNHRFFVQVPAKCTDSNYEDLTIKTRPPGRAFVRSELQSNRPGMRILEVSFEKIPTGVDRLRLVLFEDEGTLRRIGAVSIPVASDYSPALVRLSTSDLGRLDFIPSNRKARLRLGYHRNRWAKDCVVERRPGFYRVERAEDDWIIQGEPDVTGSIALQLAYRPQGLRAFLAGTEEGSHESSLPALAVFETETAIAVHTVNQPLPLLPHQPDAKIFIRVRCGLPGREHEVVVGKLYRVPFAQRDRCRIEFDRDAISPAAGTQRLRVRGGEFRQIVELKPGAGLLTYSLPVGERKEYDKVTITITHDLLSGHYTLPSQQSLGEKARYRLLLSTSSFRVGATTAMPTGMFRFGSSSVEGSVPISAGALVRMTYIQNNGREFPLGLEAGPFGTNLSGQPDFSLVLGMGLSIPVLNPNTSLQASFNIHAWVEISPTRLGRDENPFAFLFGPSFTVGRLSTTF